MEKSLLTYLEKRRNCEKLSEVFRFCTTSPTQVLKTDVLKNAWDGVATALGFIETGNHFYFNTFFSFFEKKVFIIFMWLNPLVPGARNLYSQYYLTLSLPMMNEERSLTYIFIFTLLCGASKGFMKA